MFAIKYSHDEALFFIYFVWPYVDREGPTFDHPSDESCCLYIVNPPHKSHHGIRVQDFHWEVLQFRNSCNCLHDVLLCKLVYCETKKKPIGVSPNMTEKKKVSWADMVRGKEMKGENDDFVKDKIVKSKCSG